MEIVSSNALTQLTRLRTICEGSFLICAGSWTRVLLQQQWQLRPQLGLHLMRLPAQIVQRCSSSNQSVTICAPKSQA